MKQKRQYPKVIISPKAERSVKNGHPWIYGEEIRKTEGVPQNGELVDVFAGNAFMGTGFYNSASKITIRLISRNANDVFDARFLRRRVEYAVRYRKTVQDSARGYKEINLKAMNLLPRGGYLATCSCSHFMTDDLFRKILASAAKDASVSLRQIEARRQAPDHPILWNVPETDYLKFYIFQVV